MVVPGVLGARRCRGCACGSRRAEAAAPRSIPVGRKGRPRATSAATRRRLPAVGPALGRGHAGPEGVVGPVRQLIEDLVRDLA